MWSYGGGKLLLAFSQISPLPEVANLGTRVRRISEIFPCHADLSISGSAIEQHYRTASILHTLRPHFGVCICIFAHALALHTCWILIDRNYFLVRKNLANLWFHVTQVVTRNQRSRQNRPQTEVSTIFCRRHAIVTHLEHVRIIPVARSSVGLKTSLLIPDVEHSIVATIARLP